jgi:hypothetical protein
MVKFATPIVLFALSQCFLGVRAAVTKSQKESGSTSPLRGGLKERVTRSLDASFSCKLCPNRPENEKTVVTLTVFGQQNCQGFYDAALEGGVIGQNQCNSYKGEFAPVCCGVSGDSFATDVPGPVGTPPPTIAPVASPAPTMVNFEKSCAAVTNSTGSCGGGNRANGLCSDRSCCSQYGWCGTTPEYCGTDPLYSSRGGAKSITQGESP